MSSFTTTRHELITECGPSQQMNPPLHFDAQSFDDCINEAMYSSNAVASEASSFLPLENLSLFDNQWSPPINFDYFESYIQDSTDLFFSYNNVMKNETSFPVEENVTPVCRSAVYPTCTELDVLSTIDHHSPKADHINHAFTAAGTAGGKLTWFQSIPFENKNKPKDERKQKDGYVNWTSSAPILKLTGPVHSDFTYPITDESPPEGASHIPTVVSSASEPIPNRLSYSRHSLSESRKCTPRYDSYSHPINLNPSSKDRRQREPVHFSTPNNPQDNFSDSYDHFEPTPNMLAAMPRRQKPRYEGDYYTPKWVRYTGHLKQGYCDSCVPGKWLQLKNSAYWYHKQFYHGISSVSGKPFMKPIKQRLGKGDTIEGLCHQCQRFVPASNAKKKNNYMLWYRHAHKCHLYDKPRPTSSSKTSSVSSTTSMTD